MQFLRTHPHLRPRTLIIAAVMRSRDTLAWETRVFFRSHGFLKVHTPILTTSDTEGAGEMFQVIAICTWKDEIVYHYHAAGVLARLPLEAMAQCAYGLQA